MQGYDLTEHRPKVLPCGHTFCGACLTQSIESCPFDRKPFMVPMPDNFFVLDLLQWEQLSCAVHEDSSAVAFCVQHLQPLCGICGPRHSCSIEMLADFDMTNFLLKELNCDPALSPLSNREKLNHFIKAHSNAIGVESFGTLGYLSCMKHCSFMLGNTSSGFVEASYFPKYVINLGERQTGRIITKNISNCKIDRNDILKAITDFRNQALPSKITIYGKGDASEKIIQLLKVPA